MKKILMIFAVCGLLFSSCTKPAPVQEQNEEQNEEQEEEEQQQKEPDIENYKPVPAEGYKIATLWIDFSANIKKLTKKADALKYLDIIQDSGFNAIVLDVKPVAGVVMYDSDFLEHVTQYGDFNINDMDYDFIQFFIDECHKRKMRITISTCVMTMGNGNLGPVSTKDNWEGLYCLEYLPNGLTTCQYREDGLVDIRTDRDNGIFSFLNPTHPAVHDYVIKMAKELVTKYDFDGYALDYCRYQDYNSDFSDVSRAAFEEYIGQEVQNWPDDIYSWPEGVKERAGFSAGPLYKDWCEFKASVIQGYVRDISEAVHSIKPDVDVEYWASAWWPLPGTGQNWAHDTVNRTSAYWWSTPNYYKTGFAKYLDIFQCGAYTSKLYGTGTESIQGLLEQGKGITRKAGCQFYGTISAAQSHGGKNIFPMADACYLCLDKTDGLMVFDMSHVVSHKWWDECKEGIVKWRYEKEGIEL